MSDMYQPSEDSLFLLEEVEGISASRVVEIGIGSGFVLHRYVKSNSPMLAVGTDIDTAALRATGKRDVDGTIELVRCDACEGLREGTFDLVFFNPPYLRDERERDVATSGGETGIEVTYNMVLSSLRVLVVGGRLIFLASSLSNVRRLRNLLREKGITLRRTNKMKLFFEELYSIKIVKREFSRRLQSRRRLRP